MALEIVNKTTILSKGWCLDTNGVGKGAENLTNSQLSVSRGRRLPSLSKTLRLAQIDLEDETILTEREGEQEICYFKNVQCLKMRRNLFLILDR